MENLSVGGYAVDMKSDRDHLDPVRRRILELIEESPHWDLKNLSLRIGRNLTYLQQFIFRGTPRELKERDRFQLADALGCDEAELRVGDMPRKTTLPGANTSHLHGRGVAFSPSSGPILSDMRDLPILGHAVGGQKGFFMDNGEVQGYTTRPVMLYGVRDAYAVYVYDESMTPAFKPGHTVWVDPNQPVSPGDDVIIQLMDGQAFIKQLVRRTERVLICKQYKPEDEVRFDSNNVRSIHLVVGSARIRT